ncbi:MAG TPA: TonB-dependent receptor [Ignavibacteria bacterium]|nr:TonB-dependent receptor [Ignavibacteria bacterium]
MGLLISYFKNSLFSLFFFFTITVSIFPQSGKTILSGFVSDEVTGNVLVGTNIMVYRDSIDFNKFPFRGVASNDYGFYAIPDLSIGNYFIIAKNIGYKIQVREVKVISNSGVVRYDIKLKPVNIQLNEVVVKGKRENEVSVSTIDIPISLINKLPSLSGEVSLFKSLEYIPGIKTSSEISSGLYVRGGSPDQNLTLVDGVTVYNPTHLQNFASTFNSDAIQSVKLIKGAFPAEYGGRLSSVLDIKLRSGSKERNKGKIGLGILNSNATFEGPIGKKATYIISGRKMYYDAIQKAFNKNSTIPNYNFYDINSKITYNITKNDIVTISGMFSKDNVYNPSNSKELSYNINWQNGAVNIDWLKVNSKSLLINNSISYVNYQFRTLLQGANKSSTDKDYFSFSKLEDFVFRSRLELFWHQDHTFKFGTQLSIHNYDLIYSNVFDPLLETDPNGTSKVQSTEATLFMQDEWKVSQKLKTNIGGRLYYFKTKDYFRFEPRISVSYSLTDNFTLKSAFAIAHQFLHLIVRNDISLPTDLWYPSTKEVLPSRSTQYVLGLEMSLDNKNYFISIESYYRNMKNLYEFQNSPRYNYLNGSVKNLITVGEGEAYGTEIFINKTAGDLSGWIGYTLSWTRRQFDKLNKGRVFYPRYDRRHDVSVVLSYKVSNSFNIGATWSYATGQSITTPTGQFGFQDIGLNNSTDLNFDYNQRDNFKLPAYHKLDLSFNYSFEWNNLPFKAYLAIFNVYNRKNPFAVFATKNTSSGSVLNKPELKQITLFPFLPTVGISVQF